MLLGSFLNAQTYSSIAFGNWYDAETWENGSIPPNPIPVGATVNLHHRVHLNEGEEVNNLGTINMKNGEGSVAGDLRLYGATVNNLAGGVINIQDEAGGGQKLLFLEGTGAVFNNEIGATVNSREVGSIQTFAGLGPDEATVNNAGNIIVDDTFIAVGGGTFNNLPGATIDGSTGVISISGQFYNQGTITLISLRNNGLFDGTDGSLTISDGAILGGGTHIIGDLSIADRFSYIQPNDNGTPTRYTMIGDLNVIGGRWFYIAGTTPGTEHSVLSIQGNTNITENSMRISLINGYDPPVGSSFELLNTVDGSITGTFQFISFPTVDDCTKTWEVEYQADRIIARLAPLTFTPNITTDSEDNTFPCNATSVQLEASAAYNGLGFLSYQWSTEQFGSTINVSEPGTYSVTISDGRGCSTETSITLSPDGGAPIAMINPPASTELNCLNTSIVLDASSSMVIGTPSYQWSDNSINSSLTVTTPGTYSVTVTDIDNGCSNTASIGITQNIQAPSASILSSAPELNCRTSSITLDASSSVVGGIASYQWNDNSTVATLEVNMAGTYTVTVTDTENACTDVAEFTIVDQTNSPTVNISSTETELTCLQTSIELNASANGLIGLPTYNWENSTETDNISVDAPGTYGVTVTDAATGCTNEATIEITQNITRPTAQIDSPSTELPCDPPSLTLDASSSTTIGTASYRWTDGSSEATWLIDAPGSYKLTVTDGANGCTDEATIEITPNQSAPIALITPPSDPELTCAITSITLDASGSTVNGAASYSWSDNSSEANLVITAPDSYSVTVTDLDNGCTDVTSIEIQQDIEAPTASIVPSAPAISCVTTSVVLNASSTMVQGTASYLWGDNSMSATLTVTAADTYQVIVTDSDNGCTDIAEVTVDDQSAPPMANISSTETELTCLLTSIQLNASANGLIGLPTYNWENSTETDNISVDAPGTYGVTVTDAATGCTDAATIEITQNITRPAAQIDSPSTELPCDPPSLTLDASSSTTIGTASYRWTDGSGEITLLIDAPGSYKLTVTDGANGCTDEATIEITPNQSAPIALITPPSDLELTCAITSITLDASGSTVNGAASYSWSDNSSEANLVITAPDSYSVTVTDLDNGCTDVTSIEIQQDIEAPTVNITTSDPAFTCNVTSITIDASPSMVQEIASYIWEDNSMGATRLISSAGIYTVTVTDSDNGCTGTGSIEVEQDAVNIMIEGNSEVCVGEMIAFSETAGDAVSWTWTGPSDFSEEMSSFEIPEANLANGGTYTLEVRDANGCITSEQVVIVVNELPNVVLSSNGPVCEGNTIELFETAGDGTVFQWTGPADFTGSSNSPTIPNSTLDNDGVYSIMVTDAKGCRNSNTIEVEVTRNPIISTLASLQICPNTEETLLAEGTEVVEWEWNDPLGNAFNGASLTLPYDNAVDGLYTVIGTTANGCTTTANTQVSLSPDLMIGTEFLVGNIACVGEEFRFIDYSILDENLLAGSSFLWDFGDNTSSTERDPVKGYSSPGIYDITLTITNDDCSYISIEKTITVVTCRIKGDQPYFISKVYPSPNRGDFTLSMAFKETSDLWLEIIDASGKVVHKEGFMQVDYAEPSFFLEEAGLYLIRMRHPRGIRTLRTLVLD